jgi:cobalt/nickel transport protein
MNMIRKMITTGCVAGLLLGAAGQAMAHFGMVITSDNIVTQEKKSVELTLSFSHPFEIIGMDLVKPEKFYVVRDGRKTSLLNSLKETKVMGHKAWKTAYRMKRPGVYQFAMEPKPYWEPAEDVSIIHYTKTIISAFGADAGWDEPAGLPTEIVPMLRPFGNYAGNSFTGRVLMNGKPVPGAEVEVELYNQDGSLAAPSDHHVTQVIKADANGIFTFTCPRAGWWGFAALNEADYTLPDPKGNPKGVELGAVLWIYLDTYQTK